MIDKNIWFSEIVWLLNEPNRPSWWAKTIKEVIENSFIWYRKDPKILEIWSNTGFSSIEFWTHLPQAQVIWIDVNKVSIQHSINKKNQFWLNNVEFILADWEDLPFEDGTFDLVFCSNTTSFINDKKKAISEYFRVLKGNGICALAPIYYIKTPPADLLNSVEKAIGTKIDIRSEDDWMNLFENSTTSTIYSKSHQYKNISEEKINEYTDYVMKGANLDSYSIEEINILKNRLRYFYDLFNENLKYCGYSTILLMKNYPNAEKELFFTI